MSESPRSVLVVEDEPLVALLLGQLAEEAGHKIFAVTNNEESALAALSKGEPTLALLDFDLDGKNSLNVAIECLEKAIPVIFVTGFPASTIPEGYENCPVLSKPFSPEQLDAAIRAALAG